MAPVTKRVRVPELERGPVHVRVRPGCAVYHRDLAFYGSYLLRTTPEQADQLLAAEVVEREGQSGRR
jgi:hypothetical protein